MALATGIGEGLYWLLVAFVVLIPVWVVYLALRSRFGGARHGGYGPYGTVNGGRTDPAKEFRLDRREIPGHCPSCGEPIDHEEFGRCWNCAQKFRSR